MKIKFQKLHENAILPSYAKVGDAGMDLFAVDVEHDNQRNILTYDIGLAVEIPEGFVALLFPKSSICNVDLTLTNCVGVLDSGYRGPIKAKMRKTGGTVMYQIGKAIIQMIVLPYPQIEPEWAFELSSTERGEGGFGSTNR
jgi:dUTP pyrophosphatase